MAETGLSAQDIDFHDIPFAFMRPQYWALGNFSINALPQGTIIPLEGGGHRICVSDVYLFIHDTFNFEVFGELGLWDYENKKFPAISFFDSMVLTDKDFRDFRDRHGFGKISPFFLPLYKVPGFEGECWDVK